MIDLQNNDGWNFTSDASDERKAYGLPQLLGDPVQHAECFKATSPIQQAARIDKGSNGLSILNQATAGARKNRIDF